MYEGGTREPLIVRWPGRVAAGSRCRVPVTSPDFYPTLLEAAGLPPRPEQHVDGVSLAAAARRRGRPRTGGDLLALPPLRQPGGHPRLLGAPRGLEADRVLRGRAAGALQPAGRPVRGPRPGRRPPRGGPRLCTRSWRPGGRPWPPRYRRGRNDHGQRRERRAAAGGHHRLRRPGPRPRRGLRGGRARRDRRLRRPLRGGPERPGRALRGGGHLGRLRRDAGAGAPRPGQRLHLAPPAPPHDRGGGRRRGPGDPRREADGAHVGGRPGDARGLRRARRAAHLLPPAPLRRRLRHGAAAAPRRRHRTPAPGRGRLLQPLRLGHPLVRHDVLLQRRDPGALGHGPDRRLRAPGDLRRAAGRRPACRGSASRTTWRACWPPATPATPERPTA